VFYASFRGTERDRIESETKKLWENGCNAKAKGSKAHAHKARAFVFKRPSRRVTDRRTPYSHFDFHQLRNVSVSRSPSASLTPVLRIGSLFPLRRPTLTGRLSPRDLCSPVRLTSPPTFHTTKQTGDLRSPVHVTDGHQSTQFPGCVAPFWMFE
jgi:hypothetical protein